MHTDDLDNIPDVRDGLTRKERVVLLCIDEIQKERGGRNVPTAMLYGRVVEHVNISEDELQRILQRLSGFNQNPASDD
ncbi:MAG: hypothetical protein P8090_18990 [Gammaproteobacteria bacterium]